MSSVCRCCGWACAAYVVGLPTASKKIEQSACGWLWVPRSAEKSPDFFFRPKIRSADPESIARIRKFKLLILTQLRVLYPRRWAEKKKSSYVQGQRYSPSQLSYAFCTPQDRLGSISTPGHRLIFFFRPKSGGAFCAPEFGPWTKPPALDTSSIWDVYRNTFALSFITHDWIGS